MNFILQVVEIRLYVSAAMEVRVANVVADHDDLLTQ
jgi:hypothetical protein